MVIPLFAGTVAAGATEAAGVGPATVTVLGATVTVLGEAVTVDGAEEFDPPQAVNVTVANEAAASRQMVRERITDEDTTNSTVNFQQIDRS
ncbi:hypothetical protein MAUB_56030 [Mycolicibacterium aubagnense]|uniref:Uncharacterized protein n=1 Tax=Mycolicibacterium aubagnense TaxID=319707 RepID=A0ABM7ILS6_9MYCO|nr:hypothetical protein MAUB_56030 [Mycolicibacterium aubagnense]